MNINNRLKKLKDQTGAGETFCRCVGPKTEVYLASLGADSDDPAPRLISDEVADICNVCRRPVEKDQIVIQGVDGTTKDRFPDEWNSSSNSSNHG